MNPTLFDEIGGKETVERASLFLYVNILRDNRIKHFFDKTSMEKQQRKMSAFLTKIFGGPSLYIGKDMRKAHTDAVKNGLNDEHVNAMMECVSAALHELEIDEKLITKVLQEIEHYRDDVLNR